MVGCPRSRLCRLSCPLRNEGASLVTLLPYSVPVEERRAVIGHVLAVFRAHRGTRGRRWLRFGRLSYPSRNEGPSSVTFWPFFVPVEERGGVHGHVCAVYRARGGTRGRRRARLCRLSYPSRNEREEGCREVVIGRRAWSGHSPWIEPIDTRFFPEGRGYRQLKEQEGGRYCTCGRREGFFPQQ